MRASFSKRLGAYLLDLLLIGLVLVIVGLLFPTNHNVTVLNQEMDTIHELFLHHDLTLGNYLYRYADIIHDLDQAKILLSIVNAFLILIYFILIPYFQNGRTLGQTLLGLRVVNEDDTPVSMNQLLMRNLIINGLGFLLTSLAFLYILPSFSYFLLTSMLGLLQIILMIICIVRMIRRPDRCGLQDKWSNTFVIDEKGEIKNERAN